MSQKLIMRIKSVNQYNQNHKMEKYAKKTGSFKMSDFKENKLKSLDKVIGGQAIEGEEDSESSFIRIATITGVLDGVKHNTDFCIGIC